MNRFFCWLLALALLSACSLTPTYETPAIPVSQQFHTRDFEIDRGSSTADTIHQDWLLDVKDESLRKLIDIALKNNRDLRQSTLKVAQLREEYNVKLADAFPSVAATHDAKRQKTTSGTLGNTYTLGFSTSWELDLFGRVGSLKEQAQALFLAQVETQQAAKMSLISSVSKAWYAVVADQALVDLSRQVLAARKKTFELSQVSFRAGVISELDLNQVEGLVASAENTLSQWRRQLAQDENALIFLLGQDIPSDLIEHTTWQALQGLPDLPVGTPVEMVANRPDIRAAEQTLKAANANIGAVRANFFPKLSLTAFLGAGATQYANLFRSGSDTFSVAGQINLPIFNAGGNEAKLASAKIQHQILVANYEKIVQLAFQEVSNALVSKSSLEEQLKAQTRQEEIEKERLTMVQKRYDLGVVSYFELLDAQRSLWTIEQTKIQTRLAYLQSQITLYTALGLALQKETADFSNL
jgi:multidrug efflux system outer membrane protein